MKRLIYFLAAVIVLYLISAIYRYQVTPILINFPVDELGIIPKKEVRLNLVLFFSRKNCPPCVQHIINYLNEAPESIQVVGIVKEEEIKFLDEIRETTGAKFPIKSIKKWKKYRPNYAPTLYGVGSDGKIYFVIACTALEENYWRAYVDEFMRKAEYLLLKPSLKSN